VKRIDCILKDVSFYYPLIFNEEAIKMPRKSLSQKINFPFFLLIIYGFLQLSGTPVFAGLLVFTPADNQINFGDVYINQLSYKSVLIIKTDGGDCEGEVRPDFAYPSPSGSQKIGSADFDIGPGEEVDVWIGFQSTQPGDHEFHIKITSDCGTYYKTISFHTIGYGYVQGKVADATSGEAITTSTVEPGNPYNMTVTMLNNGNYQANGYPGYHWLIANAPGYVEKMVNIEIQEGETITCNIQLDRDTDSDGILDDGDNSGQPDNYCRDGVTTNCDDNCTVIYNPDQINTDNDTLGNACDEDDDNDGMPDQWEALYSGLNPLVNDASDDLDNDGYRNIQEYIKGTDPSDPASHPTRTMPWLPLLFDEN
jgi:hypothetical protein